MSEGLLIDTHIALWLVSGHARLRVSTRALIEDCWRSGGTIFFSAVSAWEIALLAETGRIVLDIPAEAWAGRFLSRPGIEAVPLTHGAAVHACELHHLEHRDPADRFLIATAIELACPLVTYDERIADFGKKYGAQYRFTVEA